MVNIAIIDSGINVKDMSICKNISKGFSINYNGGYNSYQKDYNDLNGHGTYCASVIKRFCPKVKLTIIKILDHQKMGRSECLIEALEYLYKNPVDIISMSLSTQDEQYEKKIWEICKKIKRSGMITVASLANRANVSYPAMCEGVIGVKGALYLAEKEYMYHPSRTIQCQGSSMPVLVDALDGTYTFFGGNSKATANISGIIASLLEKVETIEEFEKVFKEHSCYKKKREQRFDISSIINSSVVISETMKNEKDFRKLFDLMTNIFEISKDKSGLLLEHSLLYPELNIEKNNLGKIIREIEKEWKIHFKKEEVTLWSIRNIATIYTLLKRTEKYENKEK